MSDLIKREDAINSIYKLKKTVIKQDILAYCDGIFDALEIVQDLPSADRPQGEWIEVDDYFIRCKCSICGWESHKYEDDVYGMPYCPNCGARMKGIDDE